MRELHLGDNRVTRFIDAPSERIDARIQHGPATVFDDGQG